MRGYGGALMRAARSYSTVGFERRAPLEMEQKLGVSRCFTADDLRRYAEVSGDSNPIHTDLESAKTAGFGGCVVHGMLAAGLFPAIIGSSFPGSVYVTQTLKFHEPALVGDELQAEVVVQEMVKLRRHYKVTFETTCFKHERSVVVNGTAVALVPLKAEG